MDDDVTWLAITITITITTIIITIPIMLLEVCQLVLSLHLLPSNWPSPLSFNLINILILPRRRITNRHYEEIMK